RSRARATAAPRDRGARLARSRRGRRGRRSRRRRSRRARAISCRGRLLGGLGRLGRILLGLDLRPQGREVQPGRHDQAEHQGEQERSPDHTGMIARVRVCCRLGPVMPVLPVAASLPYAQSYFHLGKIEFIPLPIQWFGVIVAIGVIIGAAILRRYAEWHGVSDETIRGITGWVMIPGFIGAHLFDVIAYQWHDAQDDPILIIERGKGISSYGGFIGGGLGWAFYVWWKRLPPRLMSDIAIVGLLPAFSIGRIGCTVVSDHIGAAVASDKWYS